MRPWVVRKKMSSSLADRPDIDHEPREAQMTFGAVDDETGAFWRKRTVKMAAGCMDIDLELYLVLFEVSKLLYDKTYDIDDNLIVYCVVIYISYLITKYDWPCR